MIIFLSTLCFYLYVCYLLAMILYGQQFSSSFGVKVNYGRFGWRLILSPILIPILFLAELLKGS